MKKLLYGYWWMLEVHFLQRYNFFALSRTRNKQHFRFIKNKDDSPEVIPVILLSHVALNNPTLPQSVNFFKNSVKEHIELKILKRVQIV